MRKLYKSFLALILVSVCAFSFGGCDIFGFGLNMPQPSGHNWSDWMMTAAPTCTMSGVETRFCGNNSNHTESRAISPIGHGWSEWAVSSENEFGGIEKRVCRNDKAHAETRGFHIEGTAGLSYSLTNNREYIVDGYYGASLNVVIPDYYKGLPVTTIAGFVFDKDLEFDSVQIGANIKTIGIYAFYEANVKTIYFSEGSSLEHIEDQAFAHSSLQGIALPASLKTIGENAFLDCQNLDIVGIPYDNNIEYIGSFAFGNCSKIQSFEVPAGLTSLSDGIFYGCAALTDLTFVNADNIKSIGGNAFAFCPAVASLKMSKNVISIGAQAFYTEYGRLSNDIEIPSDVVAVGNQAFCNWNKNQIIYVRGFTSQAAADAAWGAGWRDGCYANIVYNTIDSELFSKIFVRGGTLVDYNFDDEILKVDRTYYPIYDCNGNDMGSYIAFETLRIRADMGDGKYANCGIFAIYNLSSRGILAWSSEKADYEFFRYLSQCYISVDYDNLYSGGNEGMFNTITFFTEHEGIWDLERVWKEFRTIVLTPNAITTGSRGHINVKY